MVMRPPGMPSWLEVEPAARFVIRTHTDDSNPSYACGGSGTHPIEDGVQLTVSWDGYPKTIGRKLIGVPLLVAGCSDGR